jgi:hypothetical protein
MPFASSLHMRNIGKGDGILRGLCLGTVLALLLILGLNLAGHSDGVRAKLGSVVAGLRDASRS